MIKVLLVGLGKTGKVIAKYLLGQEDMKLVSVVCSPESSKIGKDIGDILGCKETGITVYGSDNIEQVVFQTRPDVVVDFSTPIATMRNARIFSRMKLNIVIGTTGFSKISLKKLHLLTKHHHNSILYAPNITLGVNVIMLLTNLASSILSDYDFRITEIHHKNKKDAPSGTALKIAQEIEKGLTLKNAHYEDYKVPIQSIRAGGVIGKHAIMIIGENDKIEISHESFTREAFAVGTIKGIRFICGKTGYFEMKDVLNLEDVLERYIEMGHRASGKKHLQIENGYY